VLEEAVLCCLARVVGGGGARMRKKCECESVLESHEPGVYETNGKSLSWHRGVIACPLPQLVSPTCPRPCSTVMVVRDERAGRGRLNQRSRQRGGS
jgi:hypothetical protein